MDKQVQDRLWNELSEESKEEIRKEYNVTDLSYCSTNKLLLEKFFGSHNLNPEPPTPKTWEDVENYYKNEVSTTEFFHLYFAYGIEKGIDDKCLATLKIAKLIELSYGGLVSEEEWEDDKIKKYVVKWCAPDKHPYNDWETRHKYFIAFHTPEQREEFMAYESNQKLVEMYYLM